jgi:hypothetical protein
MKITQRDGLPHRLQIVRWLRQGEFSLIQGPDFQTSLFRLEQAIRTIASDLGLGVTISGMLDGQAVHIIVRDRGRAGRPPNVKEDGKRIAC